MKNFVTLAPNGRFELNGSRWFCNSTVYYGRFPGTCAMSRRSRAAITKKWMGPVIREACGARR